MDILERFGLKISDCENFLTDLEGDNPSKLPLSENELDRLCEGIESYLDSYRITDSEYQELKKILM